VVHIERLKGVAAARYVAKYVGKEARERRADGTNFNMHIFGKSESVTFDDFMPTGEGAGWEVVRGTWADNASWLRRNVAVVADQMYPTPRLVVRRIHQVDLLRAWEQEPLRGILWPPGAPGAPALSSESESESESSRG
jgi:hypothetical protein